jgi:O-antigen/teichoic acid export membrane protein
VIEPSDSLTGRATIRSRFLTTVASNVVRLGIGFLATLIVARTLGAEEYGKLSFLLGSFVALSTLIDCGTSKAFYTLMSRSLRGPRFFQLFSVWTIGQFLFLLTLIVLMPDSIRQRLWLGTTTYRLVLVFASSFALNQLWPQMGSIGEAIRDTWGVQVRNIGLALGYFICVLLAVSTGVLTIETIAILNIALCATFSLGYAYRLITVLKPWTARIERSSEVFSEFKEYCSPLVTYTWVAFFYTFADYWMLMKFGGASEQGNYSVGARFATVSLLATTSIIQVLWKEVAAAQSAGDLDRVRDLYITVSRRLYLFTALISCGLVPLSKEIVALTLGNGYASAWLPLSLMLLYPIQQSLGQTTGTMLFSLGKTRTKSNIGLLHMTISMVAAYFLLAPSSNLVPGLGLSAVGLSVKMVACAAFENILLTYFVAKYLQSSWNWRLPFTIMAILTVVAIISKSGAVFFLATIGLDSPVTIVLMTLAIYVAASAGMLLKTPHLFGLDKGEIVAGAALAIESVKKFLRIAALPARVSPIRPK